MSKGFSNDILLIIHVTVALNREQFVSNTSFSIRWSCWWFPSINPRGLRQQFCEVFSSWETRRCLLFVCSQWLTILRRIAQMIVLMASFCRFIVRMCKVGLYIVLWFLLQESTENRLNPNISEQFAVSATRSFLVFFVNLINSPSLGRAFPYEAWRPMTRS